MGNLISSRNVSIFGVVLALVALATFLIVSQLSSTAGASGHGGFTGFYIGC